MSAFYWFVSFQVVLLGIFWCLNERHVEKRTAARHAADRHLYSDTGERERFLDWLKPDTVQARTDGEGHFLDRETRAAWIGWSARAKVNKEKGYAK